MISRRSEKGLFYYGVRYYDPKISACLVVKRTRWLSVDALAHEFPGWTSFHFVHNNPLNMIDPTGLSANPVFDINGIFLGTTSEGYVGEVLIYTGAEPISGSDLSNMSANQLLNSGNASSMCSIDGALTWDAISNIYTHIASQFNGTRVRGVEFNLSDTQTGRVQAEPSDIANFTTRIYGQNSDGSSQFDLFGHLLMYEYTVENIRATLIGHEYYSHGVRGVGDASNDHWRAYMWTAMYIGQHSINVTPTYRAMFRASLRSYLISEYYSGQKLTLARRNWLLQRRVNKIMGMMTPRN